MRRLIILESDDWVGTWGKHIRSTCFETLCEHQKLNHFPGTFEIGRKDKLWRNLPGLMSKHGKNQFGFMPKSYVLPQDAKTLQQVVGKNTKDKWIIKPVSLSNILSITFLKIVFL